MIVSRFAPSPNGPLHLGHAYSAVMAHDLAQDGGGRCLLRIEDIDPSRSRPELVEEFRADIAWLGLAMDDVPAQSTRLASYRKAADRLRDMGLLYPCRCSRAQISEAAVEQGPEGPIYPGTCREVAVDPSGDVAWRLDVSKALEITGPLEWEDALAGVQPARPDISGDVVLVPKHAPVAYHLAATLDDAADGVTLVTRGWDLFHATHVHRLIQALLGLPVPRWHHHALLLDEEGRKLSKSRGSGEEAGYGIAEKRRAGSDGRALAADLRAARLPAGISLG